MNIYFKNLKKALLAGCMDVPIEYTFSNYGSNTVMTDFYIGSSKSPSVPLTLENKNIEVIGPTTFCDMDITSANIKNRWISNNGEWEIIGVKEIM